MAAVQERWLSRRAVSLHLAVLVIVPGCALAAWWQITRAQDGNDLSYVYSVMWPAFGILGLYFWWMLIHTDYETVGLKGMRRRAEEATGPATAPTTMPPLPAATAGADDPELAAYNARLAELSAKGAKTWRNRETVVVRRGQ
jgi:DNA-binding transcriptional regulator of glucitol operon